MVLEKKLVYKTEAPGVDYCKTRGRKYHTTVPLNKGVFKLKAAPENKF
jgi:hypothetical protein